MAIKNGWDGAILVGSNEVGHMNSWTVTWSADALENTAFGSDDRTYQPGLRSAVVDFAGYYESTNTAQLALTANMKSTATNTAVTLICLTNRTTGAKEGWTGSGPLTNVTVGGAVDGLVPFSASVQISGGLSTYAT